MAANPAASRPLPLLPLLLLLLGLLSVAPAAGLHLREDPALPEKDGDKAYKSQADACGACKFYSSRSGAMKAFCQCYAANTKAFGATAGGFAMAASDQDDWHWACSITPAIGENFKLCYL